MSGIEEIEQAILELGSKDLQKFREWFLRLDSEVWDDQLEEDVAAGRLDAVVEEALAEHSNGRTRPL
jgi:DNA-binding PadR family transcriptional regulator